MFFEDRGEGVGKGFALEGLRPGEHLVKDRAERKDVGALVERLAPRLFGRHVGRGAENDAGVGHGRGHCGVGSRTLAVFRITFVGARQTEIQDLDGAVGSEFDVGWFQIPVNDPLIVRRLQPRGDLPGDIDHAVNR